MSVRFVCAKIRSCCTLVVIATIATLKLKATKILWRSKGNLGVSFAKFIFTCQAKSIVATVIQNKSVCKLAHSLSLINSAKTVISKELMSLRMRFAGSVKRRLLLNRHQLKPAKGCQKLEQLCAISAKHPIQNSSGMKTEATRSVLRATGMHNANDHENQKEWNYTHSL